jgi:hypothetical protein
MLLCKVCIIWSIQSFGGFQRKVIVEEKRERKKQIKVSVIPTNKIDMKLRNEKI